MKEIELTRQEDHNRLWRDFFFPPSLPRRPRPRRPEPRSVSSKRKLLPLESREQESGQTFFSGLSRELEKKLSVSSLGMSGSCDVSPLG